MNRRLFLNTLAATSAASLVRLPLAQAALPKMKITRVRVLSAAEPESALQPKRHGGDHRNRCGHHRHWRRRIARHLEAERGAADRARSAVHRTPVAGHDARVLLSAGPRKDRTRFGALDLALWDIKGKVQKLPVHQLLGGMVRNYCECYNTAGIIPGIKPGMGIKERAQATMEAGYRASVWTLLRHADQHHLQYA